jgi:hypothetical protein
VTLLAISVLIGIQVLVFIDIATIAVQVCGAALVGVVQIKKQKGEEPPLSSAAAGHILLAGLAVQTFFFAIFLCLLILAFSRLDRIPAQYRANARTVLAIDLVAALLVLLRTVYRLAVECQGESHKPLGASQAQY